jgi:hypothetical protein
MEKMILLLNVTKYVSITVIVSVLYPYFSDNKCYSPWHLKCLDPPLDAVPDGEWFCPDCEEDPGAAVGAWAAAKKSSKSKAKAKRPSSPSDPEAGVKRKASLKSKAAGMLIGLCFRMTC